MEALTPIDVIERVRGLLSDIEREVAAGAPTPDAVRQVPEMAQEAPEAVAGRDVAAAPDPVAPAQPSPAPIVLQPGEQPLAWGAHVSPKFRAFVRLMAKDFAPAQASWFMACMAFETGRTFSPSVKNPHSSATGLIQFMDATATDMRTSTLALAGMSAEDQLDYVWVYFSRRIREHGPITRLTDCYMAILNPVAMGKDDSFVMWVDGSSQYAVNAGLDANKDHQITKAEAGARVAAMLAEGYLPQNVG